MTSRFVPAGSLEDPPPTAPPDDWSIAKRQVEETRQRREQEAHNPADGGKSLYEILQQNKAAKQEAFEESIRIKNQFRALDEDEVEFLDSVLESTRAREAAVRQETTERLDIFRKRQEEADKALLLSAAGDDVVGGGAALAESVAVPADESWKVSGKKRRRAGEKEPVWKGVKLRKSSAGTATVASAAPRTTEGLSSVSTKPSESSSAPAIAAIPAPAAACTTVGAAASPGRIPLAGNLLGLAYGSDESSD
ncbi:MAG: hypothetical protein M1826_000700 [Phylliscum demangeonii]|nr:MAG: hypothetical protein M1826_000700 [Phylliscum demangeonii]